MHFNQHIKTLLIAFTKLSVLLFYLNITTAKAESNEEEADKMYEAAVEKYREGYAAQNEAAKARRDSIYDYRSNDDNDPGSGHEWVADVNYRECYELFIKASELGSIKAPASIGILYENGVHVEKDAVKAVEWYKKGAQLNDSRAQYELGKSYLEGIGIAKNDSLAFQWLKKSSDKGNDKAQEILGLCYAKGQGVEADFVLAYMWFSLSASGGNEEAAARRERMAKHMTEKQVKKAQELSSEWKPTK